MKIRIKILSLIPDLFFFTLLAGITYFSVAYYSNAQYLGTGYYDWFAQQAFRVKILQEYGLTSWIHFWANGINIWQSYQFIPHVLTLGVADLLHVSITRAMVILTLAIFIAIRLAIYVILRLSKFPSFICFTCAVISLSASMYWISVGDYSLQFGVVFSLLYFYLWQFYLRGKISLLFPFLVGLSFYIHPVLTFYSGILWILGLLFSEKKLISLKVLFEFIVFFIASSWFLYPLIFRSSYIFSNSGFESLEFLSSFLGKVSWFGFSLSLLLLFPLLFVSMFTKLSQEIKWLKLLGVYVFVVTLLVVAGSNIQLPYFLSAFQFTRGVPIVVIALCLAVAPILTKLSKSSIFKIVLVLFVTASFIESMWVNKIYAPYPITNVIDPTQAYIKLHPNLKDSNFFSSQLDTTSYFAPTTIHLPYSYNGQLDSNPVSPRIYNLVNSTYGNGEATFASADRLDSYFKVAGTQYVIFNAASPFARAYLDNNLSLGFKKEGTINTLTDMFYVFKTPWISRNAELINSSLIPSFTQFPFNNTLVSNNDFIALDNYVGNFSQTIYNSQNESLSISYPTQESIAVQIPSKRSSNVVYIDESYSKDWKATFNGTNEQVQPVGPNYMAVTLTDMTSGGRLLLKHSWPRAMIVIAWTILLTPLGIALYNLFLIIFKNKIKIYERHKNT